MVKIRTGKKRLLIFERPHPIRLLISLPFYIAAGYFVYYFLTSILDYVLHATAGEWLGALPGLSLILLFAALIAIPGALLSSSESVVASNKLRIIGKRKEWLGLHTPGKVIQYEIIKRIVCRQRTRKTTDREVGMTGGRTVSATHYVIELDTKDGAQATLIKFTEKKPAKEVAAALAEYTELPLNDRI